MYYYYYYCVSAVWCNPVKLFLVLISNLLVTAIVTSGLHLLLLVLDL